MTIMLVVLGAWLGASVATWQADRQGRAFLAAMQTEPLVLTVWADAVGRKP